MSKTKFYVIYQKQVRVFHTPRNRWKHEAAGQVLLGLIFGEWQISWSVITPVLNPGGLFKEYDLDKDAQLSTSIEEMVAVTVNYWLSKFVMEVAKKLGKRYISTEDHLWNNLCYLMLSGEEEWCRCIISSWKKQLKVMRWLAIICSIKMYSYESFSSFYHLVQRFSLFHRALVEEIKDVTVYT